MNPRTLLIYSGGLDSTVLLYHLRDPGHDVEALSFAYGQRHATELTRAAAICGRLNVPHRTADLTALSSFFSASSLVDATQEVPQGEYAETNMKSTTVPNRNMILIAIATAAAINAGATSVAIGVHHGSHTLYPDCRPLFIATMSHALHRCDWQPIQLRAPYVTKTKADIVHIGAELGVPFEHTWSCYQGGDTHCGRCATCRERREAFRLANVPDPTAYLTD